MNQEVKLIIKEDTTYIAGTKLREGGMVEIQTKKIQGEEISISIWSIKNGGLLNFGNKNILELTEMLEKDGYKEIEKL